jgi:hypothetical protein
MAEQTTGHNQVIEIELAFGFIPGRQIPAIRVRIIRSWRLKQVLANAHQITAADNPRSDVVSNRVLRLEPGLFQSVSHPTCV